MRKRGFVVSENFGDYKFTACDARLVARHGDTYWDVRRSVLVCLNAQAFRS